MSLGKKSEQCTSVSNEHVCYLTFLFSVKQKISAAGSSERNVDEKSGQYQIKKCVYANIWLAFYTGALLCKKHFYFRFLFFLANTENIYICIKIYKGVHWCMHVCMDKCLCVDISVDIGRYT